MKNLQKHPAFLLVSSLMLLEVSPQSAQAQVLINEVYPNPNTGEEEWTELINTGEETISLQDWQLWDQQSSPGIAHRFDEPIMISPQELLVVFMHSVLNNSGDELILKNAQGDAIDTFSYPSSLKGKSWARNPENFSEITQTDPTQGTANIPPSPSPTPPPATALLPELSEFMACPDDAAEWAELYNPYDSQLPLLGFSLRDSKTKILGFTDEVLDPLEYAAFELRNVLNNGGDTLSLIAPDNTVIDTAAYSQCSPETSWVKREEKWEQTAFITQNAPNIFSQYAQIPESSQPAITEPGTAAPKTDQPFLYPPSVLQPKLSLEKTGFPSHQNLAFYEPPHLERGALSVIIGSLLLLIPGFLYVKNHLNPF